MLPYTYIEILIRLSFAEETVLSAQAPTNKVAVIIIININNNNNNNNNN